MVCMLMHSRHSATVYGGIGVITLMDGAIHPTDMAGTATMALTGDSVGAAGTAAVGMDGDTTTITIPAVVGILVAADTGEAIGEEVIVTFIPIGAFPVQGAILRYAGALELGLQERMMRSSDVMLVIHGGL